MELDHLIFLITSEQALGTFSEPLSRKRIKREPRWAEKADAALP